MKRKWRMRNGNKIWIKDMSDSHLLNAMALCKRRAERMYHEEGKGIFCYPEPQGEMATLDLDSAEIAHMNSSWEDYLPNEYGALKKEAVKRKLDYHPS